ncbi:hypothetical protein AZE42_08489 [Rhizopogon vesiculosus]|uniref:DUF1275 domain protein n=1 Tax=Rhizopogon vesiculosus TaxID=180088 RepID=A0A1J8QCC0_9AGAM|nr:hypothetical protein AZE42_08489 [Rhizopogon vesiculosus]
MFKRTIKHLQHTVSPTFFPAQLIAVAFCTGILDATTYADFQTFASNQTGNAIMLPVGMVGAARVQMLGTGISLATFLFFGCLSGQIGHVLGHRKRWWLLLSSFIQATFVLIPAALLYTRSVIISQVNAPLLLFFLATSAGLQVSMARNLGVNEIPTAMLTSPFIDFLTDRHLFSGSWSDRKLMSRNRRLCYISAIWGGAFLGAVMHRYSGSKEVILMVGCMKLGIMASFWFNREVEEGKSATVTVKDEIESRGSENGSPELQPPQLSYDS